MVLLTAHFIQRRCVDLAGVTFLGDACDACDACDCASFHELDNGLAVDELATNTKTLASFMITYWEGNAFLLDDGGDGVL